MKRDRRAAFHFSADGSFVRVPVRAPSGEDREQRAGGPSGGGAQAVAGAEEARPPKADEVAGNGKDSGSIKNGGKSEQERTTASDCEFSDEDKSRLITITRQLEGIVHLAANQQDAESDEDSIFRDEEVVDQAHLHTRAKFVNVRSSSSGSGEPEHELVRLRRRIDQVQDADKSCLAEESGNSVEKSAESSSQAFARSLKGGLVRQVKQLWLMFFAQAVHRHVGLPGFIPQGVQCRRLPFCRWHFCLQARAAVEDTAGGVSKDEQKAPIHRGHGAGAEQREQRSRTQARQRSKTSTDEHDDSDFENANESSMSSSAAAANVGGPLLPTSATAATSVADVEASAKAVFQQLGGQNLLNAVSSVGFGGAVVEEYAKVQLHGVDRFQTDDQEMEEEDRAWTYRQLQSQRARREDEELREHALSLLTRGRAVDFHSELATSLGSESGGTLEGGKASPSEHARGTADGDARVGGRAARAGASTAIAAVQPAKLPSPARDTTSSYYADHLAVEDLNTSATPSVSNQARDAAGTAGTQTDSATIMFTSEEEHDTEFTGGLLNMWAQARQRDTFALLESTPPDENKSVRAETSLPAQPIPNGTGLDDEEVDYAGSTSTAPSSSSAARRVIPAYVTRRWDFTKRPVCKAADLYLQAIYHAPVLDASKIRKVGFPREVVRLHQTLVNGGIMDLDFRRLPEQTAQAVAAAKSFADRLLNATESVIGNVSEMRESVTHQYHIMTDFSSSFQAEARSQVVFSEVHEYLQRTAKAFALAQLIAVDEKNDHLATRLAEIGSGADEALVWRECGCDFRPPSIGNRGVAAADGKARKLKYAEQFRALLQYDHAETGGRAKQSGQERQSASGRSVGRDVKGNTSKIVARAGVSSSRLLAHGLVYGDETAERRPLMFPPSLEEETSGAYSLHMLEELSRGSDASLRLLRSVKDVFARLLAFLHYAFAVRLTAHSRDHGEAAGDFSMKKRKQMHSGPGGTDDAGLSYYATCGMGVAAGRAISDLLNEHNLPPATRIVTSPLLRCVQTSCGIRQGLLSTKQNSREDDGERSNCKIPVALPMRIAMSLTEVVFRDWYLAWSAPQSDGSWGGPGGEIDEGRLRPEAFRPVDEILAETLAADLDVQSEANWLNQVRTAPAKEATAAICDGNYMAQHLSADSLKLCERHLTEGGVLGSGGISDGPGPVLQDAESEAFKKQKYTWHRNESDAGLAERLAGVVRECGALYPGETVVCCTHGGPSAMCVWRLTGVHKEQGYTNINILKKTGSESSDGGAEEDGISTKAKSKYAYEPVVVRYDAHLPAVYAASASG
eukprot:g5520.t1